DFTLDELRDSYDAVFVGIGLAASNELGLRRDSMPGVESAIDYIADIRQTHDLTRLPIGRRVVVIGGGMTAIDIAVQSKRLGAETVDIVYRRGPEQMGASQYEQDLAKKDGVVIHHWARPLELCGPDHVSTIRFEHTALDENGRLVSNGDQFELTADTVFRAIGQALDTTVLGEDNAGLQLNHNRIVVDDHGRTSLPDVWAGGDCVAPGDDLTVTAVQQGKVAAMDIDRFLREQ
ncbi:MAG: FAD-dependent oxidoreductase, partial [Gammaproteobacteria bacterium]|nr:FAD-dependent oxidoreductase [Gammaproteobacteria bacterium]